MAKRPRTTHVNDRGFRRRNESYSVVFYAKPESAMLPMWLLAISLNDKKHVAAINGQTGAVALDARGKKYLQSKRRDRFV